MGFLDWIWKKNEPEQSNNFKQDSNEIQEILDKPWSEITIDDRRKICSHDPKFSIGKLDLSMQIPKDVADRLIQSSKTDEIPKKTIEITAIGNTEPICPYCNYQFKKFPQKKTKCPNCNNFVRSRKRPFDDKKVLLKEEQMTELTAQEWAKWEQSLPKRNFQPISIKALHAEVERERERNKNIFPTMTWVIPPEGCPIESHKLLDGMRVDAGEPWEIPSGEWKGYRTYSPQLFGEPALDTGCRCWIIAGFRKIDKPM
jgi:hypothetical protein